MNANVLQHDRKTARTPVFTRVFMCIHDCIENNIMDNGV